MLSQRCEPQQIYLCYKPTKLIFFFLSTLFWINTSLDVEKDELVCMTVELQQDMPCKAENWHGLSYRPYFSIHRFLCICLWVFKTLRLGCREITKRM